jgi:hypothetical protein
MKFEVHWPPAVIVWTPGWIVAVAAGAHADAALGAAIHATTAALAASASLSRRVILEYPFGSLWIRKTRRRATYPILGGFRLMSAAAFA